MARTIADLSIRVLEKVGSGAAGDTPSTTDAAALTLLYGALYQEYERREFALWDQNSIPEYVFEALADALAGRWASDQGYSPPVGSIGAEGRLKLMAAQPASGEIMVGEYF